MTAPGRAWLAGLVLAAGAAAVAGGYVIAGPPGEARARRVDDRRVSDLGSLARAIDAHTARTGTLPATLEAIAPASARPALPADPITGRPYEYVPIDGSAYEICAYFDRASANGRWRGDDRFWAHDAGRQCFRLVAPSVSPRRRPSSRRASDRTRADL